MMDYFTTRSRYPAMFFPMGWFMRYYDSDRIRKDFGSTIRIGGFIIKNNKRKDFAYPLDDVRKIQKKFVEKILQGPEYLDSLKKKLEKDGRSFLEFIEKIEAGDPGVWSDEDLLRNYTAYKEWYIELNYPIGMLIIMGIEPLVKEVQQFITGQKDFEAIIKSPELPYILAYEMDILKGSIKDAEQLQKKWSWIPFDYYGAGEWGLDHFIAELKKKKDAQRLAYLSQYQDITKRQQAEILKKYSCNVQQQLFVKALQDMNFIQDERKRIVMRSHPFFQKYLIREFERRAGIPKEELWLMTPEEIEKALQGKKKDHSQRIVSCALEIKKGAYKVLEKIPSCLATKIAGQPVQDTIKGISASSGVAKGPVRICVGSRDTALMKDGEILVAPCTTPDFIVGFKKAVAVVTDEGGLTSHAAVVSREMHLPCIVGTQNASEVLQNNDIVEVDATKGIVKIVKRFHKV